MSPDSPFSDAEHEVKRYEFEVAGRNAGRRLDSYLAARFPEYSRTFIQEMIRAGLVTVNGRTVRPAYAPSIGDQVDARIPERSRDEAPPQDIPLDIIYEDRWIVAVNKPPNMVVHPSRGHQTGTLVNALAHHFEHLSEVSGPLRAGIVHRLDRDTSGVILVVKDDRVHEEIARQFEQRNVQKEYLAVCEGRLELDSDLIDLPIGRHRRNRLKMAIGGLKARTAQTVYEVAERPGNFSVVRCFPRTGRTHQIRVHLHALRHPIVADALYGRRGRLYESDLTGREHQPDEAPLISRQALHARRLTIEHPVRGGRLTFEAPAPEDIRRLLDALREHGAYS